MSRLEPTTSALIQSLYLVVVGAGIGFSMQVLVLIVQNTSNFEDLGVATSGVTFFRTIGSSFGAAIFGSLFVNFLNRRMGPALAASGAPASAVSSPGALHRQPHSVAAPIVAAYSESLTQVFLWAAPVALLGFVLALLLREVPLRDMHASTVDLGDAFGMPTIETPDRDAGERPSLGCCGGSQACACAASPCDPIAGLTSPGVGGATHQPLFADVRDGPAHRHGRLLADTFRGPGAHLRAPGGERLRATRGRTDVADPAGVQQVAYVHSLLLAWLVDKLARSPGFEGRPDRRAVEAALERVAHRVLAQRDWPDEQPTTAIKSAAPLPGTGDHALGLVRRTIRGAGVPSRHEPNRNIC